MEGVHDRGRVGEVVIDRVLVPVEGVQGGDLHPAAEDLPPVSEPRPVHGARTARDEVEQPGTGPAVLVAGQVDHAGEHPRATRARIDVVPHVLIDPEHRDTVEPGRVGLQRFQVGAHSVPHGVPFHPQPTGQT